MLRKLSFILLLFCICGLFAAEKEILHLDFTNPHYKELITHGWGNYSIDGDKIRMHPGSGMRTALLPCNKNETIRVTFTGKADGVVGEDYKVGWCTLNFFDEAKQEFAHVDICYLRGTTEPKTFEMENVPTSRAAYFAVQFSNSGTAGVASYSDIHIYTNDKIADELIADSDFDDLLGVNYFFLKQGGKDWDGFTYFPAGGEAILDTTERVTGSKSLRLSGGGATVVSQEFPYDGEEFIFSGWVRISDDFMPGPRAGWAGGGIQIVGLDDKSVHVAHHDPCLLTRPSPWRYYEFKITFPPSVKKVQIFARLFEGAQGTVWFDQIRMRRLPSGAILPFNPQQSTLNIDVSQYETAPINYRTWAGIDALYCSWLQFDSVQQTLPWIRKAGIEMIRIREISNLLKMYQSDNPDGTPNYTFNQFDDLIDMLLGYGFIPNITIDSTPRALAREGSLQYTWCNPQPPNDMKKWGAFIEAIFRHCVERYGVNELNKWYWEIWNEPCLPSTGGGYQGSTEDFVALATEVYLAAERVEKDTPGLRIRTGMTSGGQAGASDEFIFAKLAEIGKLHLIRHRSRHYYNGISEGINMLPSRIKAMQEQGALYGDTNYESGCTEWNGTAMSSPLTDKPWCASLAIKMVKVFLDCKLDYSTFFNLVMHPEIAHKDPQLFAPNGDLAMFARTNDYNPDGFGTIKAVPKSVYNAFVMLNELKSGHRLPVERTSEPVDAIAVRMDDGTIRIILTSYDEDIGRQPYTTKVTLNFKSSDGKYRCVKNLACDNEHGNAFGEWEKLGKPGLGDRDAIDKILAKALSVELPVPNVINHDDDSFSVEVDLPSPGIRLLEFSPL